jgi:hypothetical protein
MRVLDLGTGRATSRFKSRRWWEPTAMWSAWISTPQIAAAEQRRTAMGVGNVALRQD